MEKTTQGFMGSVTVLSAPDDAAVYDAMGKDGCDVQFIVNTLFVKTRMDQTEVKTVDGEQIVFTKEYSSGQIANWNGVSLAPGYVRTSGFSPNQQRPWSQYYGSGWSPELSVIPDVDSANKLADAGVFSAGRGDAPAFPRPLQGRIVRRINKKPLIFSVKNGIDNSVKIC